MNPPPPARSWLPWRSAALGWLATAALVAAGGPLFLRMPLWCDATLYDVAARNVLRGGTHYKDVFDTNPPGFVWLLCGIRGVLGWSSEALRAVDLGIVVAITVVLLRWAAAAGASRATVAWTAAAVAAFYPFVNEMCHSQRDVWMMLPAVLAVRYRLRRTERARAGGLSTAAVLRTGFLEGLIWSVGFWIKPHVALPAVAVWLAGAARLAGGTDRPFRRLAADLVGVLTGVAVAVGAGVGWLVGTGAWPYFVDVFRNWNVNYLEMIAGELGHRFDVELAYFPPWSVFLALGVPLAVANLIAGRVWRRRPGGSGDEPQRFTRAVLAALVLGWAGMALFLQRHFDYAHIPEVLLLLALFAANRWAVAFLGLALVAVTTTLLALADGTRWQERDATWYADSVVYRYTVTRHPVADARRVRWWAGCFTPDVPRELRRDVGFKVHDFGGLDAVELGAVEDYLRRQQVAGGEVIGWHNTTHPLYLSLDLRPPIRFMHLSTVIEIGKWQYDEVREELARATPTARFVVSDLHRITQHYGELHDIDAVTQLPRRLPPWQHTQFPFNQPVVFRSPSGRYLVHAIRRPAEAWDCKVPRGLDDPTAW